MTRDAPGAADVAIIGAGVVGTAIARDAGRATTCASSCVDAAHRRRHRHHQGQHGDPAHRVRRDAGQPGEPPAAPGQRAAARLRRRGPASRWSAPAPCWSPGPPSSGGAARHRGKGAGERLHRRRGPFPPPSSTRGSHIWVRARWPALEIPDESIVCPWTTPLAYRHRGGPAPASGSLLNGLGHRACRGEAGWHTAGHHRAGPSAAAGSSTPPGWAPTASTRCSAAAAFTVRPRRGELIVFDKLARPLLGSILLPVPTARTKGVLVAPTVYGNVLLGPTARGRRGPGRHRHHRGRPGRSARRRARRSSRTWPARRSPRPTPGCGPRPSIATTRSGSSPRCATPASAASGPPGCPRRSASPSTCRPAGRGRAGCWPSAEALTPARR